MPANLTIAADGRASALARALGLAADPRRPAPLGVRRLRDGRRRHHRPWRDAHPAGALPRHRAAWRRAVQRVRRDGPRAPDGATPLDVIRRAIEADATLRGAFRTGARSRRRSRVLGPLAVDARGARRAGLLLAGDAAGFVDPMTGDGLHLAMRGAVLAAREALADARDRRPVGGAVERLAAARRARSAPSCASTARARPRRVARGGRGRRVGARVAPGLVRWAVRYAGDAA